MKISFFTTLFLVFSCLFFSCQQNSELNNNSTRNKMVMTKIYKAFETGNVDSVNNYIAYDIVDHALDTMVSKNKGPEYFRDLVKANHTAFSNIKIKINALAETGDTLLAYHTFTGINSGPFMGMPATNKFVKVNGVDIVRFKDGKAIEHWEVIDEMKMMEQLGLMTENLNKTK